MLVPGCELWWLAPGTAGTRSFSGVGCGRYMGDIWMFRHTVEVLALMVTLEIPYDGLLLQTATWTWIGGEYVVGV
jgi:hypothetical protein